jgi:predicted flap endonuclease-1-like 5' DNA nuclease
MADEYHLDLAQFSLKKFRRILETGAVLPGRRILKEQLAERFATLEALGIGNLQDLLDALKSKEKIEQLAKQSGLPKEYLVILRREANSYVPKPFNLSEIPEVEQVYIDRLAAVGIKTTQHLFARAKTKHDRAALSKLADVPPAKLVELVKLSDLARINGVGPVFARLFYEAGADTLDKLMSRSPDELFETLQAINQAKKYTKIMATVKDVAFCMTMAKELPKAIKY